MIVKIQCTGPFFPENEHRICNFPTDRPKTPQDVPRRARGYEFTDIFDMFMSVFAFQSVASSLSYLCSFFAGLAALV